jgi:glycosyltransferase involved in cell wall biosynthesis
LGISAKSRAALDNEIVVFSALDFKSPYTLLLELLAGEFCTVLFSWRFLLSDLLQSRFYSRHIDLLLANSSVGFLIPDHLGERPEFFAKEQLLAKNVDFFLVTSEILSNIYTRSKISDKFAGILHDLPDLNTLNEVRNFNFAKQNTLVWVGNSKWGERQGYRDHKGFSRFILPLGKLLTNSELQFEMKIVDSAENLLDNKSVLVEIAKARFLVLASEGEGTGLPILEALGLGTVPISTRVGVAPEVLNGKLKNFLIDSSVSQVMSILENFEDQDLYKQLKFAFDRYVSNAKSEKIPKVHSLKFGDPIKKNSLLKEIQFYFTWSFRYFRKRLGF